MSVVEGFLGGVSLRGNMIITIDGPVASGKSTAAKKIAQVLGIHFLSSGFLYRALAYVLFDRFGYDETTIANPVQADVDAAFNKHIVYLQADDGGTQILYDGVDITGQLKTTAIDHGSSLVSINEYVRSVLLTEQQNIARQGDCVIEGRDSGTVVFPHADYKFFITASLDVRARRWQDAQHAKGKVFSFDEAVIEVQARDKRDSERSIAPLTIAEGATVIDNSTLDQDQTVQKILEYI